MEPIDYVRKLEKLKSKERGDCIVEALDEMNIDPS